MLEIILVSEVVNTNRAGSAPVVAEESNPADRSPRVVLLLGKRSESFGL